MFLWEAGKIAESALREALKSKDLEVARRARISSTNSSGTSIRTRPRKSSS